jgi:hypothetical protein
MRSKLGMSMKLIHLLCYATFTTGLFSAGDPHSFPDCFVTGIEKQVETKSGMPVYISFYKIDESAYVRIQEIQANDDSDLDAFELADLIDSHFQAFYERFAEKIAKGDLRLVERDLGYVDEASGRRINYVSIRTLFLKNPEMSPHFQDFLFWRSTDHAYIVEAGYIYNGTSCDKNIEEILKNYASSTLKYNDKY